MSRPNRSVHPLLLAPLIYAVFVGAIYLFLDTESRFSGVLLGIYPHAEISFPFSIQSVSFALWSVGGGPGIVDSSRHLRLSWGRVLQSCFRRPRKSFLVKLEPQGLLAPFARFL